MVIDRRKFIAAFKSEADDLMTLLDGGLVKLEATPDDIALLDEVCRAAHTLKGASRMMGYNQIRDVAHSIEDVLFDMKTEKYSFNSEIADAIFAALDVVKGALGRVARGEPEGIDVDEVRKPIAGICESRGGGVKSSGATEKKSEVKKEHEESEKVSEDENRKTVDAEPLPPEEPADVEAATKVEEIVAELEAEVEGAGGAQNPVSASKEPGKAESTGDAHEVKGEEYIRVSLDRINRLLNLIGEMVISKVKSAYRVTQIKAISKQTRDVERMLSETKTLVKNALDVPDDLIQSGGALLRASQEFEKAADLMDHLHNVESSFDDVRSRMARLFDDIQSEVFQLSPVVEELQQKMKEIRMLPCSYIFDAYPRLVRDIARERGKSIKFEMDGADTELDKKVLEAINGPLIHILRNAVDHGMETMEERSRSGKDETGTVKLSAFQEGGMVVIVVADDGAGLDLEKVKEKALSMRIVDEEELAGMDEREVVNLIFAKGFSTSDFITDVSGRGVGLDVVRTEIERLKGTVEVETERGRGTKVRLELPLTIAVMRALLVRVAGMRWAVQMSSMDRSMSVPLSEVASIENRIVIQVDGKSVPVVPLSDVLGVAKTFKEAEGNNRTMDDMTVLIASSLDRKVGFMVDKVEGEDEVFIKTIGSHLGKVEGISGATVLASGEVIAILDMKDLINRANLAHPAVKAVKRVVEKESRKRVLVVEDSLTTRELEKAILENSGYEVVTAIDGLDALDKLSTESFDVIVSDIKMPRMDGFEFCKSIKSRDELKDVPLVFVTALSKEEEKRKGMELGAQAYITKSQFDQTNLLDTLERII